MQPIVATEGWALGVIEYCLAVVWRGQPTPEAFRQRNEELVALCKAHPGKCALIEIVEPSSKPPSDETRRVAMEVFKVVGSSLSCVGFVLEGAELRSTVARAILTGMMFFVRQLQPTRVFKSSDAMTEWVAQRVAPEERDFAPVLAHGLEQLRSSIKPPQ